MTILRAISVVANRTCRPDQRQKSRGKRWISRASNQRSTVVTGSPGIDVQDGVEGLAGGGLEVGAYGVGDGYEGALAHGVERDPEHLGRLLLEHEVEAGPGRAETAGAGRQHEAPDSREQRPPHRGGEEPGLSVDPAVDARNEQDRCLA